MGYLLDAAYRYLEARQVEVKLHPDGASFRFECAGVVSWTCVVSERNGRELLCYGVLPARIPEPLRMAAAEYITRANYGMAVGNFELDFSDGEVRYKTYLAQDGGPVTDDMLAPMLSVNHAMMKKYTPGFIRVSKGISAARAVAEVEARNLTAGFFLDGYTQARVELDDVHPLHGGRRMVIYGDGRAMVERDGRKIIGSVNASAVFEIVVENDLLGFVNPPERPRVPDEACPLIKLVNAAGEERTRGVWANDDVMPFNRVYRFLLDLESKL